MSCYKIEVYPRFKKEAKRLRKRYRSLLNDLDGLMRELLQNPYLGVDLGHGLRKVRLAITSKGKGKSGGARVITLVVEINEQQTEIGLQYIYDKSERESLTDKELTDMLRSNGIL